MLKKLLSEHPRLLTECAIAERLRRLPEVTLHPTLFNTPLIYGPAKAKAAMVAIYHDYLHVAQKAQRPLLLTAPTWRLDAKRVTEAEIPSSINEDAVDFLLSVRDHFESSAPVLVGALTGPQNDCYRPDLAPEATAAEEFHAPQISTLAATAIDFLQAQTLPSVSEALGVARAMSATRIPYLISFCTGTEGTVLDGTPLPTAFALIDQDPAVTQPPLGYYVNCTHPTFLLRHYSPGDLKRLIGIQANGSSKDVTSLDGAERTEADPIARWAQSMLQLHDVHEVPILGGCCGTATSHLEALA